MPFVKVVKTKAYFKRFQTKFRRRREGKTDYYARKRLITQDKNKYNVPKYRFVVRFTNTTVICQVIYAKIKGDVVISAAYSSELPRYGVEVGLTNWPAAYCTGLLCARRVLTKLGLADKYQGEVEPTGEFSEVEPLEDGPRPFKCYLDVGLKRTTTGAKVFAAMKGASDGGLYIPHSEKRFPGYDPDSKKLDSEVLHSYIYGGHVADYMRELEEDDEEMYKRHFASFIKAGVAADDLEDMYKDAHAAIRADPMPQKKEHSEAERAQWIADTKKSRDKKLTTAARKIKVNERKEAFLRSLAAGKDEE